MVGCRQSSDVQVRVIVMDVKMIVIVDQMGSESVQCTGRCAVSPDGLVRAVGVGS